MSLRISCGLISYISIIIVIIIIIIIIIYNLREKNSILDRDLNPGL